jgi:hypothetical protein
MNSADRRGLVARIRQIRSAYPAAEPTATDFDVRSPQARTQALETRIGHLEQMVQGLQDLVHEQSERHERRLDEVESRLVPSALAIALSRDARERGL